MDKGKPKFVIGVDLGATTVKTGLVSAPGEILYQNKLPSNALHGPEAVIEQIRKSVDDAMAQVNGNSIAGIGIGAPGIVDNEGYVKSPPNFAKWDRIPLAAKISSIFGTNVQVENDANAAAIAEAKFGAGMDLRDFLFVIWGTGVGGGIILDRKIYRGSTGGAGEIGHVSIDQNGPLCNCGSRGCVEAYVGQRYLSRQTAQRIKGGEKSIITNLVDGNLDEIEPLFISRAAEQGDLLAKTILAEAGANLGVAIAGVMNVLDLRVSIIGGGISNAGTEVMESIRTSIQRHVLKPLQPDIQVIQAKLGNNAGILGAAGLVM